MIILHNATIYSDDRVYDNFSVIIENQKIIALLPSSEVKIDGSTIIDCSGKILTPGFIDLQINGFGGKLLNSEITKECLEIMTKSARKYGATTIAPTLITTSDEKIEKALDLVKELQEEFRYDISGLHIEGPYLNMEKRGVHNPKYVRRPEINMIRKIASYAEIVSMVTLAPENATREHIQTLVESGIVVSLGHTNATYAQAMTGIENGISMATHLYNAMSGYTGREPGAIGAVFNSDIYTGIIADGFHCDYAAIEIAKKIKGDKLFLVTDAASPAGTDIKEFVFE
ncbi:MAG: N-acetylglucosamine-6-phosphate deacetylase, partial [Fusobacteria bacterium]|nr:N-acetylglucosamine-6-phosphate deacetylase [Fusobacteriota bacterium]